MGVSAIEGLPQLRKALKWHQLVKVAYAIRSHVARRTGQAGELAWVGPVQLLPVAEVPGEAADVRHRQHSPVRHLLLNSEAVLRDARRWIVFADPGHRGGYDRNRNSSALPGGVRVGEQDVVGIQAVSVWRIRGAVVHIVALNAFVHEAESTADHGFA